MSLNIMANWLADNYANTLQNFEHFCEIKGGIL
jgi:hypothetical protein